MRDETQPAGDRPQPPHRGHRPAGPPRDDLQRQRVDRGRARWPRSASGRCRAVSAPAAFTPAERRLIRRLRTPPAVQALAERAALQHRAAARARDAAQLPRRRPPRHRALPGSGARRRGDPRAARLSAARPQLRVDRRARSRDLRLPSQRDVGIGRAIARSRAARPHARCSPRRARSRSATSIRTSISPAGSPATRSSIFADDGRLRLAAVRDRTSGRWSGCCSTTRTADSQLGRAHRSAARAATSSTWQRTSNRKPIYYSGRERGSPLPQEFTRRSASCDARASEASRLERSVEAASEPSGSPRGEAPR